MLVNSYVTKIVRLIASFVVTYIGCPVSAVLHKLADVPVISGIYRMSPNCLA